MLQLQIFEQSLGAMQKVSGLPSMNNPVFPIYVNFMK